MTYSKAWILGNGKSRQGVTIPADVVVYGCNHIYKDIPVDVVVSTDVGMQHEIYQSGYANTHKCVFLDWAGVDSGIMSFINFDGDIIRNNDTGNDVVIGYHNGMNYITYLNSSDCVEVVHLHDLPMEFSSGSLAMWHAAKSGFSDITLVGFGDTTHCYTEDYTGPNPRWEKEREYIINTFFNINWRRI